MPTALVAWFLLVVLLCYWSGAFVRPLEQMGEASDSGIESTNPSA
jgi:hypothetical protein